MTFLHTPCLLKALLKSRKTQAFEIVFMPTISPICRWKNGFKNCGFTRTFVVDGLLFPRAKTVVIQNLPSLGSCFIPKVKGKRGFIINQTK